MALINLFFSIRGRISRGDFWYAILVVISGFVVRSVALDFAPVRFLEWPVSIPLYWAFMALAIKRYHDIGRSGLWLLLLLIPLVGPLWVLWSLGFRKGSRAENRYGALPNREELDYLVVGEHSRAKDTLINDVTGLNPIEVASTIRPQSVAEVQKAITNSKGPISIGGGRFSMGGQISSPGSLHLDMRGLKQVLAFSPAERWIRVQAGIRWCDIQRFLDPHDLSVKIMQTYANLTVGGSLNVNAHGRYIGQGPAILSVRSIAVVLADGSLQHASRTENSELFFGVIGGYGGLGVIVEAELDVVPNTRVALVTKKMSAREYLRFFRENVRDTGKSVFHNADLYPPLYTRVLAQTWEETDKPVTQTNRLMALRSSFPLERYFMWAVAETPLGKWRREFIIDPLLFFRQKVHWRNYEAGYDVAELEPASRAQSTYVLQEYFVPVGRIDEFIPRMAEILQRHNANTINISIRHALADSGSMLAWAREEVFAFVLYYKQGVQPLDRNHVAVWTRELIEAALACGGTYYLPYQPHASVDQFHRAYPRARAFFALKRKLDPEFRFRNSLWNKYYAPTLDDAKSPAATDSEFREVFSEVKRSDGFFLFLQNIFHLHPEDKFHHLIKEYAERRSTDHEIYEAVQAALPAIKPMLAPLTHALPALKKQKLEIARQTLQLLGDKRDINGYLEIGSVGRYINALKKHLRLSGPLYLCNDQVPTNSPPDIMERGQLSKLGQFSLLDYQPLDSKGIKPDSLDLVTCYVGLHHAPLELLDGFVKSIRRVLRPGGMFILRDHDVPDREMHVFVSLVHTVFNLGLGASWATNQKEFRRFRSISEWSQYLIERGFRDLGARVLQQNDPTDNTLMAFVKTDAPEAP
jgi:FAD/FMN-containing dehydrogenase/uncharacterized membrane protein YhaH (DUF805 family)